MQRFRLLVKSFRSISRITVNGLKAKGGGTCPEANAEALLIAIFHTKRDILFSTDASPYENTDIDSITEQLLKKSIRIRFNAMITGDCTQPDSWNKLPSAE